MNLQKIQGIIAHYREYLKSSAAKENIFPLETIRHFQENWNTESEDLYETYSQSLQNSTTRRQWKDHNFYPKEMMLKFIQTEPEYVRLAFRDLFNDSKGIEGRVNRFIFYCDELLTIYREKKPKTKENNHYHNPEIVFLYLSCRFPEKYTEYAPRQFRAFLQNVDAKNISPSHDYERFCKVSKILDTFISRDEEITKILQSRLEEKHYQEKTRFCVAELLQIGN